jgi:alkylation response protein AidB-like acyl-CoA dehydrogenase
MLAPFVSIPSSCRPIATPCGEVREFVAGELAAGLWVPNSDFGSIGGIQPAAGRPQVGMTWPKRYGGGERSMLERYAVTEELLAAALWSTCYANDRVQFGRQIVKFQAIQQQVALLAARAAARAGRRRERRECRRRGPSVVGWPSRPPRFAAGEAAGNVAEIAHQVHGAIGFTHEHSLPACPGACGRGATSSAMRATGRASSAAR